MLREKHFVSALWFCGKTEAKQHVLILFQNSLWLSKSHSGCRTWNLPWVGIRRRKVTTGFPQGHFASTASQEVQGWEGWHHWCWASCGNYQGHNECGGSKLCRKLSGRDNVRTWEPLTMEPGVKGMRRKKLLMEVWDISGCPHLVS